MTSLPGDFVVAGMLGLFAFRFLILIIPAFGEEFGWRGCCSGI